MQTQEKVNFSFPILQPLFSLINPLRITHPSLSNSWLWLARSELYILLPGGRKRDALPKISWDAVTKIWCHRCWTAKKNRQLLHLYKALNNKSCWVQPHPSTTLHVPTHLILTTVSGWKLMKDPALWWFSSSSSQPCVTQGGASCPQSLQVLHYQLWAFFPSFFWPLGITPISLETLLCINSNYSFQHLSICLIAGWFSAHLSIVQMDPQCIMGHLPIVSVRKLRPREVK